MDIEQIKSKNRVLKHGEVLTPSWVVNKMLDLLPEDGIKINSRYLENSCGEGAFLIEILKRKLNLVFNEYSETEDRKFYTVVAVTNIYGLELLKDNIETTKLRLYNLIKTYFVDQYCLNIDPRFFKVIKHILNFNIINMNTLTHQIPLSEKNVILLDDCENIIYSNELSKISEWVINYKTKEIKRVEYLYQDIVREQEDRFHYEEMLKITEPIQMSLFDYELNIDLFEIDNYVRVAKPIKFFKQVLYIKLHNAVLIKEK